MSEGILGRDKFLEKIKSKIPENFELFESGHTLYINTHIVSYAWKDFAGVGVSIRKLNFIKMLVQIDGVDVQLDKKVRHYFAFPNKNVMTFGHSGNKEGVLIELDKNLWERIKSKGSFELNLSYSLLDGKDERASFIGVKDKTGNYPSITYASLNMKINLCNIYKGNHLVINPSRFGLGQPTAFFEESIYQHYQKFRDEYDVYSRDDVITIIREAVLEKKVAWWSLTQFLEFSIEPYDIYKDRNGYETTSFLNVQGLVGSGYKKDVFFKPMGKAVFQDC